MKEKIGPTAGYAWDKNWSIEWNVPTEVEDGATGEKSVRYEHRLVVLFDIQDKDRQPIEETSRRITLFSTDEMLELENRLEILSSNEIREKIIQSLAKVKEEMAGYKMRGVD
ncbi:MAG: hypothetical protein JRH06_05550 [Deltaproteobacteria bacterium]|nr:hypothetical protein [Deltaproteobacteria bacterium]MBW2137003.1 hypothetical protein [Deltaproteobacteria bacterium]